MNMYDGPTLRAIRESMGVPLRRIARHANMSHGHLSKVERGEHGRPITPAILAAYEKVTGVSLADAAAALAEHREGVVGRRGRVWQPGQLSDMRRLAFNAAMGAIAVGGQLGDPFSRLLDSTGRPSIPLPPRQPEVEQVERLADFLTGLDLRYGGGFTGQLAKTVLRWAVAMLEVTSVASPVGRRLYGAISAVTARAAWAAFDTGAHEGARSLYRLALYTAVRSADPNLRAHVLADAAAQHNHLGYHDDALEIIRLVEGDERVAAPVRAVLHGVKARAYAATGQAEACRRSIQLAEEAHTAAGDTDGWVITLCRPAHLYATTGHAVATLALHTDSKTDLDEARQRLRAAVDGHDPATHTRAVGLCQARLAQLALHTGDLADTQHWARQALTTLTSVDSARLRRALTLVRKAIQAHPDEPALSELDRDIEAAIASSEPPALNQSTGQPSPAGAETR